MKDIQLLNSADQLDTVDAFFRNFIIAGRTLVIPYINAGIHCYPLNPDGKMKFVDKCYAVFQQIRYLGFYHGKLKSRIDLIGEDEGYDLVYLAGGNLDKDTDIHEFYIKAEIDFVQFLPSTSIRSAMWIPIDTPNFPQNMESAEVESFFNGDLMPQNIKSLIIPGL